MTNMPRGDGAASSPHADMRSAKLGTPAVVLALLCAMYFLYFVNRVSISTVAPLIKADLGISNTQLGLAFSAFAIPYAVFQLIGGWIGDRLGARLTLALCCAIVALSTVLTGAVDRRRVAVRGAPGVGIRRRRRLPHGDARDGQLDAAGTLGLRAGNRAFVRANRQRGDAADDGRAARCSHPGAAPS